MHFSTTLLITFLSFFAQATPTLSSPGFALPISQRTQVTKDDNGLTDIKRLHSSARQSIEKFDRGFHAFEKRTGTRHPSAPRLSRSEKRSPGIGVVPLYNLDWYCTISVGTPPKNFTVMIDTGSTTLFLPSTNCNTSCNGHTLYDPSQSSSAHDLQTPFDLYYADGDHVSGTLYTDNVNLGGYTANNQTFGAAGNYTTGFTLPGFKPDGLLGLAFPSSNSNTPTFWTLVAENVLPYNSFGISSTELYIGGANSQLYVGDFSYLQITQPGYWQTTIDSIYINGQQIANNIVSIFDTGTKMILGDNKSVQAFYDQIPGSAQIGSGGYYSFPCTFESDIEFQLGGRNFSLPPPIFNFGPYSSNLNACVGAFVAIGVNSNWIIGSTFLQTVYSQWDVGNKQIGFATLA